MRVFFNCFYRVCVSASKFSSLLTLQVMLARQNDEDVQLRQALVPVKSHAAWATFSPKRRAAAECGLLTLRKEQTPQTKAKQRLFASGPRS